MKWGNWRRHPMPTFSLHTHEHPMSSLTSTLLSTQVYAHRITGLMSTQVYAHPIAWLMHRTPRETWGQKFKIIFFFFSVNFSYAEIACSSVRLVRIRHVFVLDWLGLCKESCSFPLSIALRYLEKLPHNLPLCQDKSLHLSPLWKLRRPVEFQVSFHAPFP